MSIARVTATHRRLLHVRAEDGTQMPARIVGRTLSVVCGDLVRCEFDAHHRELRVVAVEPRSNGLWRSNARGGAELIAANLSQLLVVVAPLPRPDFFVVDRYLAAAHCANIPAVILMNKSDLAVDRTIETAIDRELADFAAIGFGHLPVSAHTAHGLDQLRRLLPDRRSMLVGQSGVGKSSLLRALLPDCDAPVGELIRGDEGRHTTTATRLYALPGGGEVFDSPGVRDFAPAIERLEPTALGFAEVERLAAKCRFADCQHLREPDCAVQSAVKSGAMSARRYESYRRLRRLFERLNQARRTGSR
jgi:ribosome biogenesis GTPase